MRETPLRVGALAAVLLGLYSGPGAAQKPGPFAGPASVASPPSSTAGPVSSVARPVVSPASSPRPPCGPAGCVAAPRAVDAFSDLVIAGPEALLAFARSRIDYVAVGPASGGRSVLEFSRSEVTVDAYLACVLAEVCSPAVTGEGCNWGPAASPDHPANCVDSGQAERFARWVGARLPTEAEWRGVARTAAPGRRPWGAAPATCQRAWMDEGRGPACGTGMRTAPVCSHPQGNSQAGLCDLAGNVAEWLSTPMPDDQRMVAGGSFLSDAAGTSPDHRIGYHPNLHAASIGIRLARP